MKFRPKNKVDTFMGMMSEVDQRYRKHWSQMGTERSFQHRVESLRGYATIDGITPGPERSWFRR